MRTTTFLILALLVISGCTSRTDGGARVRPLANQSDSTGPISSGIPLNDGSYNNQSANNAYNSAPTGQVQFPSYSNQPVEFPSSNNAAVNTGNTSDFSSSFPSQNTQSTPAPTTYTPPATTYAPNAPMIPGKATQAEPAESNSTYQASQNQTGAVQTLLDEANAAVKANQLEKAATALNRAVRLEPNNASIWYDLAQIRLHQGKHEQSEQLAKKSIDFAKGNQDLVNKNWRVISSARKARGDSAGADEAMRNAQ